MIWSLAQDIIKRFNYEEIIFSLSVRIISYLSFRESSSATRMLSNLYNPVIKLHMNLMNFRFFKRISTKTLYRSQYSIHKHENMKAFQLLLTWKDSSHCTAWKDDDELLNQLWKHASYFSLNPLHAGRSMYWYWYVTIDVIINLRGRYNDCATVSPLALC